MPQTVESGTSKSTLGPRAPQYPKVPVMISLTFIEQTPFPFCYVSFATSRMLLTRVNKAAERRERERYLRMTAVATTAGQHS